MLYHTNKFLCFIIFLNPYYRLSNVCKFLTDNELRVGNMECKGGQEAEEHQVEPQVAEKKLNHVRRPLPVQQAPHHRMQQEIRFRFFVLFILPNFKTATHVIIIIIVTSLHNL